MPNDAPSGLGPLPKSDPNDELEEQSTQEFLRAFPTDRFRVRSEPGKDRGCDRYLEVKLSGHDTNCRSQVQLKAVAEAKTNADGSISLSVAVSNFNYMLNGSSPLYFLWIRSRHELLYLWAHDERKRLDSESPEWLQQESITLRFRDVLNDKTLDTIHSRIRLEKQFERKMHETIVRSTATEQLTVRINLDTFAITDPKQAYEILMHSGMSIIATGFAKSILDLFGILEAECKRAPRIQLVMAYAEFALDRFDHAVGHLREASLRKVELNEGDLFFWKELRNSCEYRRGVISRDKYLSNEAALSETRSGVSAKLHRLEVLRHRHLLSRNLAEREELNQELNQLVSEIERDQTAPPVSQTNVKIVRLYANGQEIVCHFAHVVGISQLQRSLGLTRTASEWQQIEDQIQSRWSAWQREATQVLAAAGELVHPILVADAHYVRAGVVSAFALQQKGFERICAIPLSTEIDDLLRDAMSDTQYAIDLYKQSECLEAELRAKVQLADLFEFAGQPDAASALASGVQPIAEAMGYGQVLENAMDHVARSGPLAKLLSSFERADTEDLDVQIANQPDGTVNSMANDLVQSYGIPSDRLPNVIIDCEAQRAAAQQRLNWCRHLVLEQHLGHLSSPSTCYVTPPNHRCACHLRGLYSADNSDWAALISDFRSKYCESCTERSPKQG